jgi:hypothetical protein
LAVKGSDNRATDSIVVSHLSGEGLRSEPKMTEAVWGERSANSDLPDRRERIDQPVATTPHVWSKSKKRPGGK